MSATQPPADAVEAVRAASKSYEVMGVVHSESCCTTYRVTQGVVQIGGDYLDAEAADEQCERLNAEAIVATLRPAIIAEQIERDAAIAETEARDCPTGTIEHSVAWEIAAAIRQQKGPSRG